MKQILSLTACCFAFCYAASAQMKKPATQLSPKQQIETGKANPTPQQAKMEVKPNANIDKPAALVITDTIPTRVRKFYTVDNKRYLTYLNTNLEDSVKLLKAGASDWQDFETAYSKLTQTIKNNPFSNVSNYISPDRDFKSIELIDKTFLTNTAKVCLRQLIFNIKLSDVLLNKLLTDKIDLQLLSMSITNIDTLCLAYLVPYVTKSMALMKYPKIIFKVFDKDGMELNKAGCYLVSPYVCRSLACLSCKNISTPCELHTVDKIIGQKDYMFDCANPSAIGIAQGPYHIFIVNNGAIIGYKSWSTDANDLSQDFQPKTINLHVQ